MGVMFAIRRSWRLALVSAALCCTAAVLPQRVLADEVDPSLVKWLAPQDWVRDQDAPTLSLGEAGAFDDRHIFSPAIGLEDGEYRLWYCGSSGNAHDLAPQRVPDERWFRLGAATSDDGIHFQKGAKNPIFSLDDPRRSILTPTILRQADGTVIREEGKLRMWFTSSDFQGKSGGHRLQESRSVDGSSWSTPSAPQIDKAYAPTVVKRKDGYHLWYADVTSFPWKIRHARSDDGSSWDVTEEPVMVLSQPWEHHILVYPCVIEVDGALLMWYGSYLSADRLTTAIGFAVSKDGIHWHKHPQNPVVTSDPTRPWESHYAGNQTVIRLPDGRFRMYFSSRKAPPFKNLYFAINSATWAGVSVEEKAEESR